MQTAEFNTSSIQFSSVLSIVVSWKEVQEKKIFKGFLRFPIIFYCFCRQNTRNAQCQILLSSPKNFWLEIILCDVRHSKDFALTLQWIKFHSIWLCVPRKKGNKQVSAVFQRLHSYFLFSRHRSFCCLFYDSRSWSIDWGWERVTISKLHSRHVLLHLLVPGSASRFSLQVLLLICTKFGSQVSSEWNDALQFTCRTQEAYRLRYITDRTQCSLHETEYTKKVCFRGDCQSINFILNPPKGEQQTVKEKQLGRQLEWDSKWAEEWFWQGFYPGSQDNISSSHVVSTREI